MAAVNMFSLSGRTVSVPYRLLAYRQSLALLAGASTTLVHNYGRSQSKAFNVNEVMVFLRKPPAMRGHHLIRYRIVDANSIVINSDSGTNIASMGVVVVALHSAVGARVG